ncbi:MAG: alpha/beta hydrolase-fold protein [Terriglobales bacterium]
MKRLALQLASMLLCTVGCACPASAQSRVECSELPSAILHRSVRFCVILPPGYDAGKTQRYPVMYFLHGLGQNEQTLITTGAWNIAEEERHSGRIGDFLVVTPEGNASFYINSRDGKVRYEDFFIREFMPAIEHKYRTYARRSARAIGGVSMGGYGALRFAFEYPQMFSAVAVQMPALYDTLPPAFSAAAALGPRGRQFDAGGAFGTPPDEQFWEQNSPFTLAGERATQFRGLKIYFDCGDHDDYGFDAGARSLDLILAHSGVAHEFHIYPGGHDWAFVAAHFAQVLQFEWEAMSSRAETHGTPGQAQRRGEKH